MRKLLSLMSLLAMSATTVSSVVACSNGHQDLSFDFSKSVNTLECGTINVLGKAINKDAKKLPEGIINDIKNAIVTRLQDGVVASSFNNLKTSDFKITIEKLKENKTTTPIIYVVNDVIKDEAGFLAALKEGEGNQYIFKLTPTKGTEVIFKNHLCVRDYQAMTPKDLLEAHSDANPVHLFDNPIKVTQENFKEIFWNAVLGQPGEFNKEKSNFEVTIDSTELNKLEHLKADNITQVTIKIDFSIKNDFKTIQTGFSFKSGDEVKAGAINFQTKFL